jgi:hypothetical protein
MEFLSHELEVFHDKGFSSCGDQGCDFSAIAACLRFRAT